MASAKIFRINYKSDFILTLESDAGWMTPFCIKFWTGAPSQAYYVGWDGETYDHCSFDPSEPTKLQVQFDDHHLPIGDLKYQVAYHFTVADFPNDTEDEVINPANITTEIDGETYQVMLDFTGETAPEIQFALPAYANEAQRIANEQQRIAAETQRIANEETRIANEQTRINQEQTRQQNEQQRINQEQARVNEYASLKADAVAATGAANDAAALANQKAQLAADKAALAQDAANLANAKAQLAADKAALANDAAQLANDKAALAQQEAEYAQTQGGYAKDQGDYAKDQGDYAKAKGDYAKEHGDYAKDQGDYAKDKGDICAEDHQTAVADHQTAVADHQTAQSDHTTAGNDHTTAQSDHGIAVDDHTQAGNDHTRAESDHTRAESDHAAVEVYVDSLGAFDISAYHATGGVLAKYADLTAALGTNGANIPEAIRKGGMSVKYVQTSDNNYVKFFCTANEFTTDVTQWQGVDNKPTAGSKNIVESGGTANELSDIDTILTLSTNNQLIKLESQKYIDLSGSSVTMNDGKPQYSGASSTFSCGMMQCSEGDIFVISGAGGSGARLWGFVGNDGSILFVSAANITESSLILSAPANAAWIIINTRGNEASYKNMLLSNLLSQLRSSTEKITGSYLVDFVYGAYINTNVSVGSTVNLTRTNSKIFRSAIVDCVAGDVFCIDATGGTNPKTIAFVDSENKLIYNNGSAMQNRIVIAPTNSAKAIINDNTSGWTGKCYHGYLPELISKIKQDIEQIKLITGTEITATGNDDEAVLVLSASTEAGKDYYIGIKELNTTGVSDNKNILFVQDKNNSETLLTVKKNSIPQNFKFTAINDTSRIIIRAAQGTIAKLIFGGYTVQNLSTDEVTLSNLAEIMYGEPITNIGDGDTVVDLLSANTIAGHEYQIEVVSIDDTGVSDNKAILYVQNKNYTTVLASIIKGSQQRELSFVAEDNISRIRARATQGTTIKIKYNGLGKRTSGLESNVAKINQQINLDEVDKLPATSDILQPLFSTSFARIITDWGFVGASYDSGYFEDYSTTPMTGVTDYTKSWGQIFCGINNVQGYNFSRGGQTSKGWCTEQSERAWYGAQDNPKKGYTIQLGGNDLTSYDDGNPNAYPLGDPQTDIDFSDYNNNANTYCGWIAGVIQRIKSIAPKAPIFMLSINNRLSQEHDVVGWNEALKVVISRCNTELGKVYYVNQFGYPDWTNEEIARRYLVGGHPDFAGYVYLAGMFNRLIDNAIRNHIYAFKTIQFD